MPKIKIDHIISFSSEDPVHVANNILSSDTNKKWKCRNAGEISANVVLQLEKASNITGIDIGNENSAYVEILVARSGSDEDFKPLLVMSSFMTPLEARQSTNINKVRMFTYEELSEPEKKEKWDRVKIVCTQPFNRHVQYGLAFVNLHSNEVKPVENKGTLIGKFTLRPESPQTISTGSLFARRKEIQKEQKEEQLKGAAAIREASSTQTLQQYGTPTCKKKIKITPNPKRAPLDEDAEKVSKERNRNELLYDKDEETSNEKIDRIVEKKAKETQAKKEREQLEKQEKEKKDKEKKDKERKAGAKDLTPKQERKSEKESDKKPSSATKKRETFSNHKDLQNNNKRKSMDDIASPSVKKRKTVQKKLFSKLLEGVTIVISGIQNPDRANLRTSALLMGAKYKPNWDDSCTHLICAFVNTPKFNEVKGKGKIVTKKWIEDCYEQRKRFPWRRYALDKADKTGNESEEEIWEKTGDTPPSSPVPGSSNNSDQRNGYQTSKGYNSGSDTEDEIEAIRNRTKNADDDKQTKTNNNKNDDSETDENAKSTDVYNCDTEPEEITKLDTGKDITDRCKDMFEQKRFFVDTSFSKENFHLLKRHIVAYNGFLVDDPTDKIDIVITTKENIENIRDMYENAIFLLPNWIAECHRRQDLVEMDDYIL